MLDITGFGGLIDIPDPDDEEVFGSN
jgi:hypothetical protein